MSFHIYMLIPIVMIASIMEPLSHPFFIRSLLVVILLAGVFPLYGNLVLVRQEANIAHTFAHIGLLWVAVWLWFDWSITVTILCSVIVTVCLLYFLWIKQSQNHVANNEIGAQLWLVGAILIVSQMSGYRADISSYLFWDILLLGQYDLWIVWAIVWVCLIVYRLFSRQWYAISLHKSLARSKNITVTGHSLLYLIALWLLIGGAMKIIGVLLVSAFLVLPSNIGKLLSTTKKQWIVVSILTCLIISIAALFLARHRDLPSWASIIWLLILLYLGSVAFSSG